MARFVSILCAAILISGCSNEEKKDDGPKRPSVHSLLDSYLEHAIKAEKTKTHGTGEHPMHVGAMEDAEADLKGYCDTPKGKNGVRDHLDEHIDGFKKEKQDIESKRNSLRVVGRELSPEEKDWIKNGADREIKDVEFKIQALEGLRGRLPLN